MAIKCIYCGNTEGIEMHLPIFISVDAAAKYKITKKNFKKNQLKF